VLALPLAALERACRRAVSAERHIDGTSSSNSSLSLYLGIVGMLLGVLILVMHMLALSLAALERAYRRDVAAESTHRRHKLKQ